jgi:YQGE family putative transporter
MAVVLVFVGCQVFARPLLDLAYFPIQLGVTECVSSKEKRNPFTYIFTHEVGLFIGRVVGCGAFILVARNLSEDVALRYALMGIAFIQVFSAFLAQSILTDKDWCEPEEAEIGVGTLKEPADL